MLNKKQAGIIVLLFSLAFLLIMIMITLEFKKLDAFLHQDCSLPEEVCPFNTLVPGQSIAGFVLTALIAAFGVYLYTSREEKPAPQHNAPKILKTLQGDEKKVYEEIAKSGNLVFQNELIEKTGFSKVKVTRILDRLEAKHLVERRRRGMSNIVVIK